MEVYPQSNASLPPAPPHCLRKGERAVVCGFQGCSDSERLLRRMGFCEGATVHWVQGSKTALVRCRNGQFAVEGKLLESLCVIPADPCTGKKCFKCRCKRFFRRLHHRFFRRCRCQQQHLKAS
ncbi:MAG: ferrous iron transport protein A [Opitutales bacterium]|nr:ferrous iron transport protein A [Opitutales bacterium]